MNGAEIPEAVAVGSFFRKPGGDRKRQIATEKWGIKGGIWESPYSKGKEAAERKE